MFFYIESHLSLPAEATSASRARTFVRDLLASWHAEEFEEPATLLTSELVTNAVLHARSAVEVTVRLADGRLWVGVSDAAAGPPVRKRYGPEAATGRGLLLVERIARAWGSESSATGKVVWFELGEGAQDRVVDAIAADFAADIAELGGESVGGGPDGRPRHRPPGPVVRRRHRSGDREVVYG
ncbi:MAG: ATP-binding protein [Actinomycetota bacterium]|nr:ATP-binding protein [Actinomycetota bacterium]